MCGFRALPIWNEARLLTSAAYQFLSGPRTMERAGTAASIQSACIALMGSIQQLGERGGDDPPALTAAGNAVRRIATLLSEAHKEGLIGTLELVLMIRGAATIKQTLSKEHFSQQGTAHDQNSESQACLYLRRG